MLLFVLLRRPMTSNGVDFNLYAGSLVMTSSGELIGYLVSSFLLKSFTQLDQLIYTRALHNGGTLHSLYLVLTTTIMSTYLGS